MSDSRVDEYELAAVEAVHAMHHPYNLDCVNDPDVACRIRNEARVDVQEALSAVPNGWAKLGGQWVRIEERDALEVFTASDGDPVIRPTPGPLYKVVAHNEGVQA